MKTKTLIAAYALTETTVLPPQDCAQDVLTGDIRLACEVILYLAKASSPGEFTVTLTRYFSISLRRLRDTARADANFLNMRPRVNQTSPMTAYLTTRQDKPEAATDAAPAMKARPMADADPAQ